MRTLSINAYELETETSDEQREAGRYHPASVIVWKGHRHSIGAGNADEVDIFTEAGGLFVLARNRGLNYAGLEVFRDGEKCGDCFVDLEDQADYINGLTPVYAAKMLANWCDQ